MTKTKSRADWKILPDPPRPQTHDELFDEWWRLIAVGANEVEILAALDRLKSCDNFEILDEDE